MNQRVTLKLSRFLLPANKETAGHQGAIEAMIRNPPIRQRTGLPHKKDLDVACVAGTTGVVRIDCHGRG